MNMSAFTTNAVKVVYGFSILCVFTQNEEKYNCITI